MASLDHAKVLERGYAVIEGLDTYPPEAGLEFTVQTSQGSFTAVVTKKKEINNE